jgi:hypothetical protein
MTITVHKSVPVTQSVPYANGVTAMWLLVVTLEVVDSNGADNNLFVFQSSPDPAVPDSFACVASAVQLRTLSTVRNQGNSLYRNSQAVFLCRSLTEMDTVWTTILEDLQMLSNDWQKLSATAQSSSVQILPGQTTDPSNNPVVIDTLRPYMKLSSDGKYMQYYDSEGNFLGSSILTSDNS